MDHQAELDRELKRVATWGEKVTEEQLEVNYSYYIMLLKHGVKDKIKKVSHLPASQLTIGDVYSFTLFGTHIVNESSDRGGGPNHVLLLKLQDRLEEIHTNSKK